MKMINRNGLLLLCLFARVAHAVEEPVQHETERGQQSKTQEGQVEQKSPTWHEALQQRAQEAKAKVLSKVQDVKGTVASAVKDVQSNDSGIWQKVKDTASDVSEWAAQKGRFVARKLGKRDLVMDAVDAFKNLNMDHSNIDSLQTAYKEAVDALTYEDGTVKKGYKKALQEVDAMYQGNVKILAEKKDFIPNLVSGFERFARTSGSTDTQVSGHFKQSVETLQQALTEKRITQEQYSQAYAQLKSVYDAKLTAAPVFEAVSSEKSEVADVRGVKESHEAAAQQSVVTREKVVNKSKPEIQEADKQRADEWYIAIKQQNPQAAYGKKLLRALEQKIQGKDFRMSVQELESTLKAFKFTDGAGVSKVLTDAQIQKLLNSYVQVNALRAKRK